MDCNTVSQEKKDGGLALGGIINRNRALLGKWLWRFPMEQQNLWATVIRNKFGDILNGWDAVNLHSSHWSPWRGISQILPLLLSHTNLSLGCGTKFRFWLDPWVDLLSLSSHFPHLFNLSRCFAFLSSSPDWDFHFRRYLRDSKVIELSSLIVLLQNSHLSPTRPDSCLWSLTSSSLFSVSSFFSALSVPSSSVPFPFKTIWFAHIPSKFHAFL